LHNEELQNWEPLPKTYYPGDKIKENEMGDILGNIGGGGEDGKKNV